jgi:uncharacterized protein RhaS with RHS repeats
MPLQRNEFLPQDMVQVYTSSSGMVDTRTGYPYPWGGLIVGGYFDLTEQEAQLYGRSQLHWGRYRFVQIDSGATAAYIVQGSVGLMASVAKGPNIVTSYDKGLGLQGNVSPLRPVIFLAAVTAAQVLAGAYVFIQERGYATCIGKSGGVTNTTPLIGDVINSIANGFCDDAASPGSIVPQTIGYALTPPNHGASGGTFGVWLDLASVEG